MRIAKVTPISVAYPEPNDSGATRYLTFCRIETTDGTVGWGESVTMWPEACRATEQVISGMGELILGRDVADNIAIWRSCAITPGGMDIAAGFLTLPSRRSTWPCGT